MLGCNWLFSGVHTFSLGRTPSYVQSFHNIDGLGPTLELGLTGIFLNFNLFIVLVSRLPVFWGQTVRAMTHASLNCLLAVGQTILTRKEMSNLRDTWLTLLALHHLRGPHQDATRIPGLARPVRVKWASRSFLIFYSIFYVFAPKFPAITSAWWAPTRSGCFHFTTHNWLQPVPFGDESGLPKTGRGSSRFAIVHVLVNRSSRAMRWVPRWVTKSSPCKWK